MRGQAATVEVMLLLAAAAAMVVQMNHWHTRAREAEGERTWSF